MRKLMVSSLILWLCIPPALAAPSSQEILAKAKQAAGGNAWNSIRTTHATLTLKTSGLNGTLEIWEDNVTGHSLARYQMGPASGA